MSYKRSIRNLFLSLSVLGFIALAGSAVATQAQCGRPAAKPTNTNAESTSPQSSNSATTNPQGAMSNMDMSGCPCPTCKSGGGGCANGSCSLKAHNAAKANESGAVTTKRRGTRARPKKKTP